uniref:Minor tail protein n=1 Tax=Siphoviridae sp. ctTC45 TaxID=2827573 RepID=A0A8S5LQ24_9CAUD|nr:MAG TPA: minor tail protein [Siphoviridae sp. ctTC45]
MVKFTANVKNAKNEWQKLSGTVKADGSLTNISLKNIQGKQANNLDNVLNGNSNTSQLSNKEDILKDIEKSLKTIYDYRVKIASTNDTDTLNDLQSKLSSEEQQYKQLVDNYKTNYSAHPNDLDDDFRNVVKPVKVKGRKNIRVASADAILDKITEQQAEVSKLKTLDGSIFKDEGDNSFDDYLQDQENKLNELIKKYKQYGDVVQDVQQKIEDAKANGSNEGISQADTLRANYESVNKIHGELQNGNQQGFLEKYYKSASDAVDSLIGKQQQGEEITKKELQNVQSLYNEYKKIANAGTPLADNIRGKVNADSYILNNAKQQGTIISQGEFKETDISKGLATTIIKIRNAKGEIRDLQYTWHNGMISMADNTKKVQTSLVGVPKIMDALSKKSKELITYWTANYINPYKIIEMIQKGVNIVKELDTALVDLRKTTTMSSTDLKDFYSDANEAAKEYGVTTKQIIDQASSWSRLGYSDKNSATEMAKLSSQFATISPGMDIDKATTGLVSTMKAKLCLCVQKCAYRKYLIAGNA